MSFGPEKERIVYRDRQQSTSSPTMLAIVLDRRWDRGDPQFDRTRNWGEAGNVARLMTHNFPVQEREDISARPPRETLYAAKRALFERNNSLLLFALCVVSLALGAVLFWTHGVYVASLERQPIYFGIDTETGAIMALRPEALHVKNTDEILRHHIESFVSQALLAPAGNYRTGGQGHTADDGFRHDRAGNGGREGPEGDCGP